VQKDAYKKQSGVMEDGREREREGGGGFRKYLVNIHALMYVADIYG
jgi:hypothetical protein